MFFPTLRLQSRTISSHVFNSPPGHLMYSGEKGLQYNACNNSLNKYNASQVLYMPATEREINYSCLRMSENLLQPPILLY